MNRIIFLFLMHPQKRKDELKQHILNEKDAQIQSLQKQLLNNNSQSEQSPTH